MTAAAISSADDVPRLRHTKRPPRIIEDVSEHRLRGSASAGAVTTAVGGWGGCFHRFHLSADGRLTGADARNTRNPAFPPDKKRPPSCNSGTKLQAYSDFEYLRKI